MLHHVEILRVEITPDQGFDLLNDLAANQFDMRMMHDREGPITVEGVAYYQVINLPEPGWRVINPMAPD